MTPFRIDPRKVSTLLRPRMRPLPIQPRVDHRECHAGYPVGIATTSDYTSSYAVAACADGDCVLCCPDGYTYDGNLCRPPALPSAPKLPSFSVSGMGNMTPPWTTKNIRYTGLSRTQPMNVGIPDVYPGDWMASRNGTLTYIRQPWEAGPFVTLESDEPLSEQIGQVGEQIGQVVGSVVGGARSTIANEITAQTTSNVVEQLRPYLLWGLLGVAVVAGVVGYLMGAKDE